MHAKGMFYFLQGGFKAVIWADVFQSVIIVIGIFAILIQVSSQCDFVLPCILCRADKLQGLEFPN